MTLEVLITDKLEVSPAELASLFDDSTINRPTQNIDLIKAMIEGSNLLICAWIREVELENKTTAKSYREDLDASAVTFTFDLDRLRSKVTDDRSNGKHESPYVDHQPTGESLPKESSYGKTLAGVARSVTDFSYCCYLSDLAVASKFQGRGIGIALVEATKSSIGDGVSLILIAAPSAVDYYPKLGFEGVDSAYMIRRK